MSKNTNPNTVLVPMNMDQLPSTQIGRDDQFADFAKSADCVGRLQLFTKGKAVDKKLIGPGNYGIPESDGDVIDLGDTIDILPFARRPKAIDVTNCEAIIVSYDPDTAEFKRMAATAMEKESHCMYGPSFLVYERSRNLFLEFFCGNKASRIEAKNLYPYLPLSQTDIDARKVWGNDVSDLVPHGPLPATLKSRLVEKGTYSWHVPVVVKCVEPFEKLPSMDLIVKEIMAFLTVKDNGVARVAPVPTGRAASRHLTPPDLPQGPGGVIESQSCLAVGDQRRRRIGPTPPERNGRAAQ